LGPPADPLKESPRDRRETDQEEIVPSFKDLYLAMQSKRSASEAAVETGTEAEEAEEAEEVVETPVEESEGFVVVPAPKRKRRGGKRHRKEKSEGGTTPGLDIRGFIRECQAQGLSVDDAQLLWVRRQQGLVEHDPRPAPAETVGKKEAEEEKSEGEGSGASCSGVASSKFSSTRTLCREKSWIEPCVLHALVVYPCYTYVVVGPCCMLLLQASLV
jgi:hypothetical protein